MPLDLKPYAAVLLDLDGTVYHEDHPLPGAVALMQRLIDAHHPFACLSNSTTSPMYVCQRLNRMNLELSPDHIYTAAAAACDAVLEKFGKNARVFNLATEGVQDMLEGMVTWVQTGGEPCDAIIIGAPSNAYAGEERQRIALQLARKGALLLGCCADRVYPSARGIELGSGALSWMLAYAAAAEPTFCGKPQAIFFQRLCQRLEVDPRKCLLIGDNLESDIAGARGLGMRTILTLTGVTRRRDLLRAQDAQKPDLVVEDLTELK